MFGKDEIWGKSEKSYKYAAENLDNIIKSLETDTGDDLEWWTKINRR
jgi:hypothetical protein